jgi:RNA polymerase sigma factor (sigma-70 family)
MRNTPNGLDAERLVKEYDNLARKIASKYAGGVDFEDLYQTARMAIWDASKTFDSQRGSLNTHLYKRALWAVLEHVKAERGGLIRLPIDSGEERDAPKGPRPVCVSVGSEGREAPDNDDDFQTVERSEALAALCKAALLTTKQSDVIRMLFSEGLTFGEVVTRLGCTEQNLHYLRKAALDKLRAAARSQGVEPEDLLG